MAKGYEVIHGHEEGELCNFYCYEQPTFWHLIAEAFHLTK